jgi:hypothetical protein
MTERYCNVLYCILLYSGTNRHLLWVLLGVFAKFRKATISFVMSVRRLVCMEQIRFRYTDFFMKLYNGGFY